MINAFRARIESLTGHQDFQLVSGSTIGVLLVKVLGTLAAFLVQIPLTRILGVGEYGAYIYVWSWIVILTTFLRLGLDNTLIKYIPIYVSGSEWPRLKGVLAIALGTPPALMLIFLIVGKFSNITHFIPHGLKIVPCVTLPLLILFPVNQMLQAALRGLKSVVLPEFIETLAKPVVMLALFLMLIKGHVAGADNALMAQLGVVVLATIFLSTLLVRKLPVGAAQAGTDVKMLKTWAAFSGPMLLLAGLSIIISRTDIVMLGMLGGPADAGVYAIASRMAEFTTFGLLASNSIMAPLIAELYHAEGQRERLQSILRMSAWFIFLFTSIACILLLALGPFLLPLFGPDFKAAYTPMAILLCGQLINALAGPVGFLMTMTGHQNEVTKVIGIAAVLNIIGNGLAIPVFGTVGAALVTSACILFWNLVLLARVRRTLHLNPTILRVKPQ